MDDGPETLDPARSSESSAPLPPSPVNSLSDEDAAYEAYARYEKTWDLAHLDNAIALHQRASDAAPEPDADLLGQLGYCLTVRYLALGQLDDLERGIAAAQHALKLTSDEHIDQPLRLNNLAWSLRNRYERLGELNDLKRAMTMQQRSVELESDASGLDNLGTLYRLRYERFGELDDLERSIANRQRAAELEPDDHPDKPIRLNNLGVSLRRRFERLGEPDDLERAIAAQRRAVELTPEGHPDMPLYLDNLGFLQYLRYKRFGDLEDLERAIAGRRRAVELSPSDHPNKPTMLHNLGVSLQAYFDRERTAQRFNEVVSCFIAATADLLESPSSYLETAKYTVKLLNENPEFSTPATLILAYSRVVDILPEIAWLGHSLTRRLDESKQFGELVNGAVCTAIGAGALEQAAEWLEAGRGLIWTQAMSLRSPIDDLERVHPELARPLRRVLAELQDTVHASSHREAPALVDRNGFPISSTATEEDRHRGLAIEYGKLLSEVRSQPGFDSFMRPKKLSALTPSSAALSGPVVFINVDQMRCDALILRSDGKVISITLPELSLHEAVKLRAHWQSFLQQKHVRERGPSTHAASRRRTGPTSAMRSLTSIWRRVRKRSMIVQPQRLSRVNTLALKILHCLWKWVVHPVLVALGFAPVKATCDALPHVTWCPTGPLAQLPLHAAGIYGKESGPRVYDYVVSSYTPSLSALTRSIDALSKRQADPSVLVVTQADTPGMANLPGATNEAKHLQEVFSSSKVDSALLDGELASTGAVRAVLDNHPWLHLACHGYQDIDNPLESAFALHDGPLSLADLMSTTSDNAELAFLSACQTAVGDEKIPEESMHLAAGMLAVGYKGVIATMWSIRDDDAPLVVEAYYRKLLELRASETFGKGKTGAAYALHEATKRLREHIGVENVIQWAPFVHFGI